MDTNNFIWFIKERKAIRSMKEMGFPKPWTDDPILAQCHFLNIEYLHDPGTIRLHKYIEAMSDWEKLFYIFIYRAVYSSPRFLKDMTGIWMHDFRNLKLFKWKSYSEDTPYSYNLGQRSIKDFVIDFVLPILKMFWQSFGGLDGAEIEDVEVELSRLFALYTRRKYRLLSSMVTMDMVHQFPERINPDSKCYISYPIRRMLKDCEVNIEKLRDLAGMNYSSLNRALGEYYKYQKRKEFYDEKGYLREEWLIKTL
jgi:hypothetical protein